MEEPPFHAAEWKKPRQMPYEPNFVVVERKKPVVIIIISILIVCRR